MLSPRRFIPVRIKTSLPALNKGLVWSLFYVGMLLLWTAAFTSTFSSWIFRKPLLIDTDTDLSIFTVPFLSFNLIFLASTFYIFIGFIVFYGRVKDKQIRAVQAHSHKIAFDSASEAGMCSIVIPARNEEAVIRNSVLRCLKQSYRNIEVIVVCHNCTDRTFELAQVGDDRVHAFDFNSKEAGKGLALNYGVSKAKGQYILILDADGYLSEDFIEKALPLFYEGNYAAVQGRYVPSNRNYNFITRMLALEGDLWSAPFMTCRDIEKRCPLGGTGYIIRKDVLLDVGGFANHLVDDYELSFRLFRKKQRIAYAPLSINYDEKPPTIDFMLRQRARWVKGFLSLMKSRVAEPRDILGNLYWLNPLSAFTSFGLLLIAAYSAFHNFILGYYPFEYAYLPFELWLVLNGGLLAGYTLALWKQYGTSGLRHAAWLPLYIPFSNYWMVIAIRALFVKSWANTKTMHGFVKELEVQIQLDNKYHK